jgi:PAS domain S-box-containing protein
LIKADKELRLRREAEAALQKREAFLQAITDNIQDMVTLVALDGRVQYASPAFERQLGYKPEALVGQQGFALMHPEDVPVGQVLLETAVREGYVADLIKFRARHADGRYIWVEASAQFINDADGAVGIVTVLRDVTAQQAAEAQIRSQNEALVALHAITLDILKHRELDGLLQTLVRRATELLDAPHAEMMLLEGDELVVQACVPNLSSVVGERVRADEAKLSWQAVQTQQPAILDDYATWPHHRAIYDNATPLHAVADFPILNGPHCLGVLAVGRHQPDYPFSEQQIQTGSLLAQLAALALDNARLYTAAQTELAERKQAEENLRQSNAELFQRNDELDAFAHTVAHDLKNPLALIVGFGELLQERQGQLSSEETSHIYQIIVNSARKTNTIIEALLLLASTRRQDIEMELLAVSSVVTETLHRLADTLEQAGVVVEVIAPGTWPLVWGYAPWVEEILVNYISNALKYGGRPPHIILNATLQADGFVRFSVRDNGPGLTPEQQKRLFRPFERLGATATPGTGLGLTIVNRIAGKMGGRAGLESAIGQGSTFYFTLPNEALTPLQLRQHPADNQVV